MAKVNSAKAIMRFTKYKPPAQSDVKREAEPLRNEARMPCLEMLGDAQDDRKEQLSTPRVYYEKGWIEKAFEREYKSRDPNESSNCGEQALGQLAKRRCVANLCATRAWE